MSATTQSTPLWSVINDFCALMANFLQATLF
jgi:hypothetical protein